MRTPTGISPPSFRGGRIVSLYASSRLVLSVRRPSPQRCTGSVRLVRDRDGLESRVGADRAHQVADVVAHRFNAELELVGDLLRRATALEKLEDLRLSRSQVELGMCVGL